MEEKKESPKQIKYEDIEDIVESLVSAKSSSYSFDVYGSDDIGQEIRMICLRALKHFDASREPRERWNNFFGRCVDNGLKNLKRDNYIRPAGKCSPECKGLHGEEYLITNKEGVCKKWLKDKEKIQKRIGIMHPINIEAIGDIIRDLKEDKNNSFRELKLFLFEKIPQELHELLEEMIEGRGINLTLNQRRKVQKAVKKALEKKEEQ